MNDTKTIEKLNKRQQYILKYLLLHTNSSHEEIAKSIPKESRPTRVTVSRDLKELVELGYLNTEGKTKGVDYSINPNKLFEIPLNIDEYYDQPSDERSIAYSNFNPQVFDYICTFAFSEEESEVFNKGRKHLLQKLDYLEDIYTKKELERFTIELSWKSSQIEGNTYSLLETEDLIMNQKKAEGHDQLEALMILNHKKAFDMILENRKSYESISLHDIRTIHSVLIEQMGVPDGIRESAVGITGTKYTPLDNKWQIEEVMNNLIKSIENTDDVPLKAFLLLVFISYIQPFADGNKRTARMVSNAILLAHGFYPLSYRSVSEIEFKQALILFYEQNTLYHLKRIFIEQQKFAIDTYFR